MPSIAVFIDAENIEPIYADQIFAYASAAGTVTVKEIYGAGIALNEWAAPILQHAIHTNVTLRPNRYKNSSDIALVIGAMDLLARRTLAARLRDMPGKELPEPLADIIIIASSDSDFSALAVRLRSAGMEVVGIGNVEKTNSAWRIACTKFVSLTEVQLAEPEQAARAGEERSPSKAASELSQGNAHGPEQPRRQRREASTHSARAENIRTYISALLASSGGAMQTTPFFRLLNEDPDYRFDQRGSKRNPLDYLTQHYSDVLRVEKRGDGTLWILSAAPEGARGIRRQSTEPALPRPEAAPPRSEAAAPRPETALPRPSADKQNQGISAGIFTAAGIAEETAQQIAAICSESHNLRAIYNRLRKAFGSTEGRQYYQIVKKHSHRLAGAEGEQE